MNSIRSPRLYWLGGAVLAGMVAVFLMLLITSQPQHWNLLLQDWLMRQTTTEDLPKDFALVALDEVSIQLDIDPEEIAASRALTLMEQGFPWSREVYGLLAEQLLEAGARMVIFDILLPSSREGDEKFAAVLRRYPGQIVLASNFEIAKADGRPDVPYYYPPTPELGEAVGDGVGFATFPPQSEGIRYVALDATIYSIFGEASLEGDIAIPFLGSVSARLLGQEVPVDLRPRRFRYSRPKSVPLVPLYLPFIPHEWKHRYQDGKFFQDRVVLVGATAEGLKDYFSTPFGRLSGPEIQLHALAAIRRDQWLSQAGAGTTLATIPLAAAGILLLAWLRRSSWQFVLGVGGGVLLWFLICWGGLDLWSYFFPLAAPLLTWGLCGFAALAADVALERRERGRMRGTLERYVSKDVVHEILENPDSYLQGLGGQRKEVVALFSDLQGFTETSESLDPSDMVAQLNEYFGEMVEAVNGRKGTIDKFMGDALLASWGGIRQASPREDACMALEAALEMRVRLGVLNAARQARGESPWGSGCGLCQGPAIFGNIGSQHKMDPTVIGDTVNLASRIEGLTRFYGCPVLTDERVAKNAEGVADFLLIDVVRVKGRRQPEKLFFPHREGVLPWRESFLVARELYLAADFSVALEAFDKLSAFEFPAPALACCFRARCEAFLKKPAAPDWDGVWDFLNK